MHNKNPFKGKTFEQIGNMIEKKGFQIKGPDPINGKGMYINPKSGYKYYLDNGLKFNEKPHVDIWYPKNPNLEKARYFLDGTKNVKRIK